MKKRYRICIAGYAGCGNLGDDAILQGLLLGLFENGVPLRRVLVLSGRPKWDARRFGVRCLCRKNPFSILFALFSSELFLLGGGTLLQNATGNFSLFYYRSLLRLARLCGTRTAVAGGLGPLLSPSARRQVKTALEDCDAILFRDGESARFARELGVKNRRVTVGADPAFLLPPPPPLRTAFLHRALTGSLQKAYFCVCPCGKTGFDALASFLSRRMPPFYPVYLLCDPARDRPAAEKLQKRFGGVLYLPRDASDAAAVFFGAELVVSCRLHPLILSCRAGTRALCFSGGDPKLSAFCRAAGIPLLFDSETDAVFPTVVDLLSRPVPNPFFFCRKAAKDLAILAGMVYNRGVKSSPAGRRKGGRQPHDKRATGGSAPPGIL